MADHARRRGSAGPHGNKILRDVFRANPIDKDQTQKILKISGNTQRRIERAVLFIDRPTAIERRMGRHESQPHQSPVEDPRRVVSDAVGQIVVIDIMDIPIDGIHVRIGQSPGDMFKHVVRRIEIIRIEQSDNISGRHPDPLVHGIVDSLVRLGDPSHTSLETRLIATDNIQGIILGSPIHDHIVNIGITLSKHTFQCVRQGLTAIVSSSNN